jgi:peptidoglycan/LPS O-acetylase OafA/YrhL
MGQSPRHGYQPALDGVRAVSIALVLTFHLGAPWLEGGYLGVSVFFTLSGFLITSLLLRERTSTGRIDIRSFYVRRLRRLLPASMLCLGGVALLAAVGTVAARDDLRAGVLGALLQVANWEQLLGNHSYADLFVSPSPVDHFWSLAIEEQFYWLWPLAMAGLTALAPRRVARVLVGAFVVFGASAFLTARVLGGDAAYFASWARFAEILAGAALAAVLAGRSVPAWVARLAAPCLFVVVVLSVLTPAGRGWAYEGGLPLFAVVSAGLVLGVQADGPVARLLALEPIPWLGRISYGLYLFHWPVFTILGDASVLEKLTLTFAVSVASYYLIEQPIRTGRWMRQPIDFMHAASIGFLAAVGGIAVLVPVVEHVDPAAPVVLGAAPAAAVVAAPPTSTIASEVPPPPPVAPDPSMPITATPNPDASTTTIDVPVVAAEAPAAPSRPKVVAVFGDSVADWLLRDSAASFDRTDVSVIDAAIEGCDGVVDEPEARHRTGNAMPVPEGCDEWPVTYPRAVEASGGRVDVAVLMVGNRPIVDHRVGGQWISPCDDMQWYIEDLRVRLDWLESHADRVVVVLPAWGGRGLSFFATDDHLVRTACVREQMTGVVAGSGAALIDLSTILCPLGPEGACPDIRLDGLHVVAAEAPGVLDWVLDAALAS